MIYLLLGAAPRSLPVFDPSYFQAVPDLPGNRSRNDVYNALQLQSILGSNDRALLFPQYRKKKVLGCPNTVGGLRNSLLS